MILVIAMPCFQLIVAALRKSLRVRISIPMFLLIVALGTIPTRLLADAELKMSLVVNRETTWGLAAQRFADAIKYRTQGRIQIKNYFNGQLFAGQQLTEFALLQQGVADFVIGSTINWSPQVSELNLFSLPFMFSELHGSRCRGGGRAGYAPFQADRAARRSSTCMGGERL
jgi:TRAP-type C4-dicarboxylate transport system substrate-binding protein